MSESSIQHSWNTRARVPYWSRASRPRYLWPGGKKLAVWVVPNLEYYEYLPARYDFRDQFARIEHPDVMQWGFRDYGNRVGIWRMAEALGDYPVKVTASTNLAIFEHCPEIATLVRERNWEVMSHGLYNTRYLGRSDAAEERESIALEVGLTKKHTGQELRGLLGPCVTNSPDTMDIIAEAGLIYHADWVHDDVPAPIAVKAGRLLSIPYNYDINDGPALEGHFDGAYLENVCIAQFDRLLAESGETGLVYCLPLHTYLIGQPHAIGHLRRILDYVCQREEVWFATGGEIAAAALAALEQAAMMPAAAIAAPKPTPSKPAPPAQARRAESGRTVEAPSGRLQRGAPDHPHHAWAPLPARTPLRFTNGLALAICPIICFESHEDSVPADWPQPHWLAGGVGARPDPNIARIGQRDYGLRAGWPRLRDALARHGMRYAAAMDVLTAEGLPDLRRRVAADVASGMAEWVGHGLSVNRPIHNRMSRDAERAYIAETKMRLSAFGIVPRGWLGIEYGESVRTPELVAEAGIAFLLDWCNDEQPYAMTVPKGSLTALTPLADLDDAFCFAAPRGITPRSYGARLAGAAAGLAEDGKHSARVLLWVMRPFLSGQPFRIGPIEQAFATMVKTPGVWFATPSEILAAMA
jgi:peptidoglycan/xylan/chitin deacetylase (PgdA/CDA1 family)